jgi:endonuclease/exonuclease/phosphatase family metal-dependent hydrolase
MTAVRHPALALLLLLAGLPALLAAAPAAAAETPVAGTSLVLREVAGAPLLMLGLHGPGLQPAALDPRAGAALLLGASSAPGRCRIERPLDPAHWIRLGRGATPRAWIHLDLRPESRVLALLLPGVLYAVASGEAAACDLAGPQALPIPVELRAGQARLCAAFGGQVIHDEPGHFEARHAPAPAGCVDADLTLANLNVLHGLGCPGQCRLADRVALLFDFLEERGCPDVVTLQEVAEVEGFVPLSVREAIEAESAARCPFQYETFFQATTGLDEELVLSRYPILDAEVRVLHNGFVAPLRHVTFVRVDHPVGALDVFTTHLASGSDLATSPCNNFWFACPAECVAAGSATVRQCQALQVARFVEERHVGPAPAVLAGDFNADAASAEIANFVGRGWLDTHLEAGNPECDPASGAGCTSGRESDDLAEIESPEPSLDERIDFVFLVPPEPGSTCAAILDGPADADGDGTGTRLFAEEPNPFAPACGALPDAVCWPSDHAGNELDLGCAP